VAVTTTPVPISGAITSLRFMQPTLPRLEDVLSLYRDVYRTGVITNAALVQRLEAAVAERLSVRHCVAVSSCTSGLILTLKALGIRGKVILPSFTFFASGEALLWNGITPVFADCLGDAWNVDPADVKRRITDSVSAILGVHMYGNPCDVQALEHIANDAGIKLIFDAAHAFGSSYCGTPVGGFGDAEVFSLSPTKLLVAGEGGLVTTNDSTLAHRLRAARNYGDLGSYDPMLCGLNARMSEFNAALALSGLSFVETKVDRHNEIAQRYSAHLSGIPGVALQRISMHSRCTYKDFSFCLTDEQTSWTSAALCEELAGYDIPTKRYFYPPLHQQQIFSKFHHEHDLPLHCTEAVSNGVVSLPIYESLANSDVDRIGLTVRELLLNPTR
jgi:dTDP-4-amino-4,6-dideoxygalactose transaminase